VNVDITTEIDAPAKASAVRMKSRLPGTNSAISSVYSTAACATEGHHRVLESPRRSCLPAMRRANRNDLAQLKRADGNAP
jgi:hypothetical protein